MIDLPPGQFKVIFCGPSGPGVGVGVGAAVGPGVGVGVGVGVGTGQAEPCFVQALPQLSTPVVEVPQAGAGAEQEPFG